ncbi:hypothetical protein Pmani_028304 [Petrolisthes manimaculis]|uniref:Uncharacterized protein n=1 Tax=Petrolisthes manimaculis TaxID=1843537 RepID=A0AAE1P2D7_9EUCA|nr:hypothetical protein Pmani_028304 [Petrolisthes manimaculis]
MIDGPKMEAGDPGGGCERKTTQGGCDGWRQTTPATLPPSHLLHSLTPYLHLPSIPPPSHLLHSLTPYLHLTSTPPSSHGTYTYLPHHHHHTSYIHTLPTVHLPSTPPLSHLSYIHISPTSAFHVNSSSYLLLNPHPTPVWLSSWEPPPIPTQLAQVGARLEEEIQVSGTHNSYTYFPPDLWDNQLSRWFIFLLYRDNMCTTRGAS